MFFRLFSSYRPYVLLLLPLAAFALWFQGFMEAPRLDLVHFRQVSPLSMICSWKTLAAWPMTSKVLSFVLLMTFAYLMIYLNNRYIIVEQRTYVQAFFYLLIVSALPKLEQLNPELIGAFFLLWALNKLMSIYRDTKLAKFFEMGFVLSIASLLYINYAWLLLFFIIGVLMFKSFNFRELFLFLLGFFMPFGFLYFYFWFTDQFHVYWLKLQTMMFENNHLVFHDMLNDHQLVYYAFLALLLFRALIHVFSSFYMRKIRVRKYFNIFFWLMLFSIVLMYFTPSLSKGIIYLMAIPATFFLTDYFLSIRKKWAAEFLIFILIASLVAIRYAEHIPLEVR
jgi:hypothetical protein